MKNRRQRESKMRDEMQEESLQSKAKAAADCVVQVQRGEVCEEQQVTSVESEEISEVGREGGDKAQEEGIWEVGQPCFVATKWKDESSETCGGDQAAVQRRKLREYEKSANVHMTRKDMDVLLQNVKRLTEIVENAGKLQSEGGSEKRRIKSSGSG